MPAKYTEQQAIAAFWNKVAIAGPDECWIWQGATYRGRWVYGEVKWNRRVVAAHRIAFFLAGGVLADGENVCHVCDVTLCCNPKHLFAGTQRVNVEDCIRKGRSSKGERHAIAKLTDDEVRQIRQEYAAGGVSQKQLAETHQVGQTTISLIVRRKIWRHLL